MQDNEILNQITELTAQINALPKGYISKKSINGKLYFYISGLKKDKNRASI